jgi:hypothetical protein
MRRVLEGYGLDATGWGSPFLLVPEVTSLDQNTRDQLAAAREEDLYQSDASPLGILFNNLRGSSSEECTHQQIEKGKPGSACPKGYLVSNTEFTEKPICTASKEYKALKLKAMGYDAVPALEGANPALRYVYAKQCICDQLGNGALIEMEETAVRAPVSVCPGPNIAYFDRMYTMREIIDHIYGRGPSLVPADRPHMFAKDLRLYVDYYERLVNKHSLIGDPGQDYLREFKENLETRLRSPAHNARLLRSHAHPSDRRTRVQSGRPQSATAFRHHQQVRQRPVLAGYECARQTDHPREWEWIGASRRCRRRRTRD